jgi:hypothetical protein
MMLNEFLSWFPMQLQQTKAGDITRIVCARLCASEEGVQPCSFQATWTDYHSATPPYCASAPLTQLVHARHALCAQARAAGGQPQQLEWDPALEGRIVGGAGFSYAFNNGWVPGTLNSSLSTNAVMRN